MFSSANNIVVQLSPREQGEAGGELASNTVPPNACDVIPKFLRIEVSDTGDYIPWNGAKTLKPGDHIAWLKFASYYHHAIVVEAEDEYNIKVVEMSWSGNNEDTAQTRRCGCSPLYRVYYPDDVLKYSGEEVVRRAKKLANSKKSSAVEEREDASTKKTRKRWRPWNNCEHSATWCKADCSRCGQFRILFCCTLLTYLRRPLMSLLHISLIMLFSEYFEKNSARGDEFGVLLLLGFEFIYLIIVTCLIIADYKRGGDFISSNGLSTKKRMYWAFLKSLLQSLVMVSLAIVFGVGVKNAIEAQHGPWDSRRKRFAVEAGLGILGGFIGNIVGFLLFFFIPHQHCKKCL
ncbi:hypothetical protein HOLleu_22462 [Holothuria leucospilota]|uniref:LRAT domain-containing protein n=1 Tax=Holothuria leucospilota TaxID=206669 RepID=A0A9Q1BZ35_HOLLE|nr:hypothetical protein HOLleu_22462 [Holothuria leucospilota]